MEILYTYIYSTKKYSLLGWCYKYMYIYLVVHVCHKQPLLEPLHIMMLDTTTWSPRHDHSTTWPLCSHGKLYIYRKKMWSKTYKVKDGRKFEKKKKSSWRIRAEFLKIELEITQNWKNFLKEFKLDFSKWSKNTQRSKDLSEKVQVKFLSYCPLYIYIKMYIGMKNWKMIENVKQ